MNKLYDTSETLSRVRQLYYGEEKSLAVTASKLGVSPSTLTAFMNKHNMERRPPGKTTQTYDPAKSRALTQEMSKNKQKYIKEAAENQKRLRATSRIAREAGITGPTGREGRNFT